MLPRVAERPSRDPARGAATAGALVVASLLFAGAAGADMEDEIDRCAKEQRGDARIACLEAALRATAAEGEGHTAPASAAEPRDAGVPAPGPASTAKGTAPRPAPRDADVPGQKAPDVAADPAPARTGLDALGMERVEASAGEGESYTATVIAFDVVGYRRLQVELDNGQVWRQIDGDRRDVSRGLRGEENFEVELWKTGLGGYRMKIGPLGRTIRVDRVR